MLATAEVTALAQSFEALLDRLGELQVTTLRKWRRDDVAGESLVDKDPPPVANPGVGDGATDASSPSGALPTDPAGETPPAPRPPPKRGGKPTRKALYISKSVAYGVMEQAARLLVDTFTPHAPGGGVEAAIANIVEGVF